jgi:hypothetical protein
MKGGRKLSSWNIFVKKIYQEGKSKNANYDFKQALSDASKRKGEMGSMKHHNAMGVKSMKNKKSSKKHMKGGKKTRKNKSRR